MRSLQRGQGLPEPFKTNEPVMPAGKGAPLVSNFYSKSSEPKILLHPFLSFPCVQSRGTIVQTTQQMPASRVDGASLSTKGAR